MFFIITIIIVFLFMWDRSGRESAEISKFLSRCRRCLPKIDEHFPIARRSNFL